MCGINGIISTKSILNIEQRIERMNGSLAHRGPDHDGKLCINHKFGFGHRRLSIIDLDSRSNQPMVSNSGRYVVVFNGEIFNFNEIRKELNYNFKTNSDTEVILASIELMKFDWFLKIANGMFAIALFDKQTEELILIRDRFGIKPLFYCLNNDLLVFSSEIKGILSSGLIDAQFRQEAIDEYLGNRNVREPYTFFENIKQVKCSCLITFNKNLNYKEEQYWELPRLNFTNSFDEREIVEETGNQIELAINRWLISDVKVGAYLSGGVDSSLTTAYIAKSKNTVDTYTIGFEDKGYNEFEYARLVAQKYNTKHREFILNKVSYLEEWERLIWFKDAPLGVPNEIPLSIMSTNLSKDITVVISGEGADELFGGYGKIYRLPFDYYNSNEKGSSFYNEFINHYEYVPRNIRDKYLLTNNIREYFDNQLISDFNNFSNEENVFRFFHKYHITGLLQRVDMNTMQTSVEARPPFLDHELIEFVYKNVPFDLKLKWKSKEAKAKASSQKATQYSEELDIPKYILKEIAKEYLPNEIIHRRKVGFPVPLTNWVPDLIYQADRVLINAEWIRQDKIKEMISEVKLTNRSGQQLWMFLNIEMFKQKYFTKSWRWK